MTMLSELLWTLQSKGVMIHSYGDGGGDQLSFIRLFLSPQDLCGWQEMLERLNVVYGQPYRLVDLQTRNGDMSLYMVMLNTPVDNADKLAKEIRILSQAVSLDEHRCYRVSGDRTFDLKVGVSCNNNCVHCVIKPNIYAIKKAAPDKVILDSGIGMQCTLDLSYEDIVAILDKQNNVHSFVITGGEPTWRKDFLAIMKWLYYNKPTSSISLQTNGRNLQDKTLVRGLRRYSRTINFVVAVHGMEKTHNEIVNNRKETGNPYLETIQAIRNINEVFGPNHIRSEMVLSSFNMCELVGSVKFQHEELGISHIGISYPHLDGFSNKEIARLAPRMLDFLPVMRELNAYAVDHPDLVIRLEEVPMCVYNMMGTGKIALRSFAWRERTNTSLNFMGSENLDFNSSWKRDHLKFKVCEQCVLNCECVGTWKETRDQNEDGILPVLTISPEFKELICGC